MEFDFGGYATKNNIRCSDGRTIRRDAFKHNDGQTVPLVWQHLHNDPGNILGHAMLENREDGVYAYCKFNDTSAGVNAKELVEHGDITQLSIYANELKQNGSDVIHGSIKEVSLVLAGANRGAVIDNLAIQHSDGSIIESDDEAIIYGAELSHAEGTGETLQDIFNTLNEKQKNMVYAMLGYLADEDDEVEHSDDEEEGDYYIMKNNTFEGSNNEPKNTLSHSEFKAICQEAIDGKADSLRDVFLAHAATAEMPNGQSGVDYGITDIEYLFPEYRDVRDTPDMLKRDDAWVASVIGGTNKTPFSRIKTSVVDVTADVARARGYKKGHLKKEEVIKMAKRVTGPTTIYKKQRLDRDDIIDITSMDVVSFLKKEMQMMLREEIARAILFSDGRDIASEDKINEESIRPIYKEDELYAYHIEHDLTDGDYGKLIDSIALSLVDYKGSGSPTFYTSKRIHLRMKMVKDSTGRKLYNSDSELADALGVSSIVEVPLVDEITSSDGKPLIGIIVNLRDYTVGTNRGGETTFFDDFDIDFNQYKYLYETRLSGALTRYDSAVIIEGKAPVSRNATPTVNTKSTGTSE